MAHGDLTHHDDNFEVWYHAVSEEIKSLTLQMIHRDDLADQPYYDWYEDGYTAHEAAEAALEREGFPL